MKTLLVISRLIVGLLFIFSGIVKAIDPVGLAIKLQDYFVVFEDSFGLPFTAFNGIALMLSFFMCSLEVLLGVALIIGYKQRSFGWVLLIMIIFFTWLTGFSAITGKVTDCGCFGDAIPLTPKQSFIKDLILLVFIAFIFMKRKTISSFLPNKGGMLATYGVGVISLLISTWAYIHLPIIDFRAYKIGNNIVEKMDDGIPDVIETTLVYTNKETGEEKEFSIKNIPSDTMWSWKETINDVIEEGKLPSIHDFVLSDDDGNAMTDLVINNPNPVLLVIVHDVSQSNKESFDRINKLVSTLKEHEVEIKGITSSSYEELDPFRHEVQASFGFFYADATVLKTMIRSNPGMMLLKDGVILGKWHYHDVPSFEEINNSLNR